MLFAGILLFSVGYTLIYAGVKGDKYQITVGSKTTPAWQAPWLPFVAVFSRSSAITFHDETVNTDAFYSAAAAAAGALPDSSSAGGGSTYQSPPSYSPPAPAPAAPPSNLPPPGPGQIYA